jgi:hypothetical protein
MRVRARARERQTSHKRFQTNELYHMDHHLKFRFDHIKQAAAALGKSEPVRYPAGSTPMLFRSKCKPVPIGTEAEAGNAPAAVPADEVRARRLARAKESPQVQRQVKQLQFWLKVFSRFCQDTHAEE